MMKNELTMFISILFEFEKKNELFKSYLNDQVVVEVILKDIETKEVLERAKVYKATSLFCFIQVHNLFLEAILMMVEETRKVDFSMKELAVRCNCSPTKMRRIFNRVCSMPPKKVFAKFRLLKGRRILREEVNKSVKEVAGECGFKTPEVFCKNFKKEYGVSPNQYREIILSNRY